MSTYPMSGQLPQSARYLGEFVPDYNAAVQYYYLVVAYDRTRAPLTNTSPALTVNGPTVLDGDHAISINWSPVIGASFFTVFKKAGAAPVATDVFYIASGTETEILDVGYPCATRNSYLNPGVSPLFMAVGEPPVIVNPCDDPTYVDPCAEVKDPCAEAAPVKEAEA